MHRRCWRAEQAHGSSCIRARVFDEVSSLYHLESPITRVIASGSASRTRLSAVTWIASSL